MTNRRKHIAIIGAGPIGLEAALAAAEAGYSFTLYEAASQVAGYVRSWGHVRLFTPWRLSVSARMHRALESDHQEVPEKTACPSGAELVEHVLRPVSELPQVQEGLRLGVRVLGVGRLGLLKHEEIGSVERAQRPFRLLVRSAGQEAYETADIVLDCSGNPFPNALGDGGIPALGEEAVAKSIVREVPDLKWEAPDWAGRVILLVGAGHSAQTVLLGLVELANRNAETRIIWAMKSHDQQWGLVKNDPLPERARLTASASGLANDPPDCLQVVRGAVIESIQEQNGRLGVDLRNVSGSLKTVVVDRILALTGRVGDHMLYRQLQVHECYATSGPMKLAAALMGAGSEGDCMQQASQGAESLRNPEPDFFILGSKSYGRRTDFLMRVGWQQVDEVFQLLEE